MWAVYLVHQILAFYEHWNLHKKSVTNTPTKMHAGTHIQLTNAHIHAHTFHYNIDKEWPAKGRVKKIKKLNENKLGLSCAKLSLASAKLHTSLSSDQHKLATN